MEMLFFMLGRSRQKIKSSILSRKMLRLGFKVKSASRIPSRIELFVVIGLFALRAYIEMELLFSFVLALGHSGFILG